MNSRTNIIEIDARERRGTSATMVAPCKAWSLDARRLGAIAAWALREEATLTPKPGLVDCRGSGAHTDMDLAMLLRSADALEPHFVRIAECAASMPFGVALRARLDQIGRDAEAAMLAATAGVNTHRGAIWALGLLVAAHASLAGSPLKSGRIQDLGSSFSRRRAQQANGEAGPKGARTALTKRESNDFVVEFALARQKGLDSRMRGNDELEAICRRAGRISHIPTVAEMSHSHGAAMRERFGALGARNESHVAAKVDAGGICNEAARIARLPTVAVPSASHGTAMCSRYAVYGARGEAQGAFPHVHNVALPALRSARSRYGDESTARLQALAALIATLDDTCLLYRGGAEALAFAQSGARRVLDRGIDTEDGRCALDELDRGLLARNASPGGSADLLAATLLLDRIESLHVESHDVDSLQAASLHVEWLDAESLQMESLRMESPHLESGTETTDGNA